MMNRLIFLRYQCKTLVMGLSIFSMSACDQSPKHEPISQVSIIGTWKLLTGTLIKGQDTVVTDYTINQESIKIISDTHFAFLRHDLKLDSNAIFVAGGGRSVIKDNQYTEYLDYCNFREWENHEFHFEFEIVGDTLTTTGMEEVASLGVSQLNIEQYVRVK